jgi:hypothetical protein
MTTDRATTTTILFSDLVGSTELLQRAGDEDAQRLFKAHYQLLRDAVSQHSGAEVKSLGDGLMVAFPSAADAVRCAIAMQQMSHRPVNGEHLAIRVGLNAGDALRDEGDYFGTSVVTARRLCDRAGPGQILCSTLVEGLLAGTASTGRFLPQISSISGGWSSTSSAVWSRADAPRPATAFVRTWPGGDGSRSGGRRTKPTSARSDLHAVGSPVCCRHANGGGIFDAGSSVGERAMQVADGTRVFVTSKAMNKTRPALIHPTGAARRGPRPRSWYEACVRHGLRNYANPRTLRRNPLIDTAGITALAEARFSDTWNPQVAALRHAIARSVDEVLKSADGVDQHALEVVLRGVQQGKTIGAIAAELSYGREWLHRTWWPEAVRATTTVMIQRYLRTAELSAEAVADAPGQLRPAV